MCVLAKRGDKGGEKHEVVDHPKDHEHFEFYCIWGVCMGPLVDKWEFQLDQSDQICHGMRMCEECGFKILREITKGHRPGKSIGFARFCFHERICNSKTHVWPLHAFLGKGRCFQVQVCSSKLKWRNTIPADELRGSLKPSAGHPITDGLNRESPNALLQLQLKTRDSFANSILERFHPNLNY